MGKWMEQQIMARLVEQHSCEVDGATLDKSRWVEQDWIG